jgi:hypothetical protein
VGGKQVLVLDRSGLLQINGRNITVDGAEIGLRGGRISKVTPGGARQKEVQIQDLGGLQGAVALAELKLVDLDGQPVIHQELQIKFADGTARRGVTGADGQAKVPGTAPGQFELTVAEGGEGAARPPGKAERSTNQGATRVERGKTYRLATGKSHLLELPERNAMTISFMLEVPPDSGYPKYLLESEDGSYRVEKGPRDDLVKGDASLDLRFEALRAGLRYRLTRFDEAEVSEVVFEDQPYELVVDQPRRYVEQPEAVEMFVLEESAEGAEMPEGEAS